jgi:predicted site-specific integrase-resolvase
MEQVPLPVAAARLGMSWHVVYRLALSGRLGPLTRRDNRWHVTTAGVEAFKEQQQQESSRQQASAGTV